METMMLNLLEFIFNNNMTLGPLRDNIMTGTWKPAWDMVVNIYNNVAMPIALFFMILWLLKAMIDNALIHKGSWELILGKPLMYFMGGYIVMKYGLSLIESIYALSTSLINMIVGNGGDSMGVQDRVDLYNGLFKWKHADQFFVNGDEVGVRKLSNPFTTIGYALTLLLPAAISIIIQVIAAATIYGRQVEMYLRVAFSPIALSDMYAEGSSGAGWRWIKNLFALTMQGALILVVINLTGYLILSLTTSGTFFQVIIPYLAVSMAQVTLIGMTRSISKELFGV